MPNTYAATNPKKFLDADGLAHFAQKLNEYPTNDVIVAVIDGVQDALDEKVDNDKVGVANGVASLGSDGKIPVSQLPGGSSDTTYTLTQDQTDGHVITLTPSSGSPMTVTIPDNDTTYSPATHSADGLMSSADKTKLDGIAENATANLGTITGITMNGASKGTSGVVDLGTVLTEHQDISGKADKSEIPTKVSQLTNDSGFTANTGTITGIKMNGASKGSSGVVDLGTVITAHQDISGKLNTSLKGAANGLAELDENGKVPSSQLPSYVDDVLEFTNKDSFPLTGEAGKIYVDKATNKTYRWGGSDYVEISPSLALGTTSSTAFRGDHGNIAYAHATAKGSAYSSGLYKITTNSEGHVTNAVAVEKSDITALGIPGTNTTYAFDGTYNASTNKAATVSTVANAIEALGEAAAKGVDTSIAAASTSTNLPTSAAVASFVEGKGYKTTDNDTKNTAGATDSSSKLFLIGATSQAANPQTYSHDTAYVGTDGCLYSGGTKVLTAHQDISGKVNKSGDTMSGKLTLQKGINEIITGTGTAGQAGSATVAYKPALWSFNLGMTPVEGDRLTIKIPVAVVDAGVWMSVDNGTNYYPVACINTSRLTTQYPVDETIEVVFQTGRTTALYGNTKDGAAAGASTANVTMSRWCVLNYYDANTTYSAMSSTEMNTGTAKTSRVMTAKNLKAGLNAVLKATSGDVQLYGVHLTGQVPAPTAENNGKIVQIVNGVYSLVPAITDAEIDALFA